MKDESPVDAALRRVAGEQSTSGASECVRQNLMAEVRSIRRARRRRTMCISALAAAVAIVAAAAAWRVVGPPTANPEPARIEVRVAPAPDEVATDFLPLIYSNVPTSGRRIVRVEVPRNALASFGLASFDIDVPPTAHSTVVADVVVGDDGLARAVRFVTRRSEEESQR
jgi:hypothetical protein